jgi:hypothetical protein
MAGKLRPFSNPGLKAGGNDCSAFRTQERGIGFALPSGMKRHLLCLGMMLAMFAPEGYAIPIHKQLGKKGSTDFQEVPFPSGVNSEHFPPGKALGHGKPDPGIPAHAQVPSFVFASPASTVASPALTTLPSPFVPIEAIPETLPIAFTPSQQVSEIATATVRIPDNGSTFLLLAGSLGVVGLFRFCVTQKATVH